MEGAMGACLGACSDALGNVSWIPVGCCGGCEALAGGGTTRAKVCSIPSSSGGEPLAGGGTTRAEVCSVLSSRACPADFDCGCGNFPASTTSCEPDGGSDDVFA